MKIFAIIVTFNGKKWYDKCIGGLLNSTIPVRIVVVDNNSSDGTVEYISSHYNSVYIVENKENLGFAKANNIGIQYAMENDADYVFLLNQDAWVEENTIELLLKTFSDNDGVGIASPIHLNGSYSGLDSGFCNYVGVACISDIYMNKLKPYYEVTFVNAAAWLISSECIMKVGGFDTSLFRHYGEDDNYAQRVYYHNMRIIVNTLCTICHDREQRKVSPATSSFNTSDPFFYDRNQKGNILQNYDSQQVIRRKRKLFLLACLGLYHKKAGQLKREIEFEKQVAKSREINIKGGLAWLT